nr:MAG TPA: hypothetical protein [Caudoviricetes sp.]
MPEPNPAVFILITIFFLLFYKQNLLILNI